MLRLLLPPNLATAAPRNAIAVKVEVDLTSPPSAALLPVLAKLQALGVPPQPVSFIQLKAEQLRQLVQLGSGQPLFFWVNQPTAPLLWLGPRLRGVSEHLPAAPAPAPEPVAAPSPAQPAAPAFRPAATRNYGPPARIDGSDHYLAISLPSREHSSYEDLLDLLKRTGFRLEPRNRQWWLRDRSKTLAFLAQYGSHLKTHLGAETTTNFDQRTRHLEYAEIEAMVDADAQGFAVTVGLSAGGIDSNTLRQAAASGQGFVEAGKKVFLFDPQKLETLTAAQAKLAQQVDAPFAPTRTVRIPAARISEVDDLLTELAPGFAPPETWKARKVALGDLGSLPPAPIAESLAALLRPYQKLGVAWLWHLYRNDLGGILADEMGLGKTLQAIALLGAARDLPRSGRAQPRPHLVVCPASLVENWRRELLRFAPDLVVWIQHGDKRATEPADFNGQDVVLTSYGTLSRDVELLAEVDFDLIIGDEAQHLKNRRTQAARSLRRLQGRGRFLLTGTPLENALDDLRSLFAFLMPGFLPEVPTGLKRDEKQWYDERLKAQTAPYLLRRTKKLVAPELPEKIEQTLFCEPSARQLRDYRKLHEDTERQLQDLEMSGANQGQLRMATLTQLLRLRQHCCDPRLLPGADVTSVVDSAKLEAFREVLAETLDQGSRMLVFSQFTALLGLLRAELEAQEIPYAYLDGSMTTKARQTQVDAFQENEDLPVFLISLKAGGTGLNLTGADVVVHYDPWWNPAAEAQATDRAHRIGQTKVVTSYRLICAGTVEEKVLALQDEKRALLADVFEASDAAQARLGLGDLRELLK